MCLAWHMYLKLRLVNFQIEEKTLGSENDVVYVFYDSETMWIKTFEYLWRAQSKEF